MFLLDVLERFQDQFLVLTQDFLSNHQLCLHWNSCMNTSGQGCRYKSTSKCFHTEKTTMRKIKICHNNSEALECFTLMKQTYFLKFSKLKCLTAMDKEAYAIPFLVQISLSPKGLLFSLHTAGTIIRGMFPRFPVQIKPKIIRNIASKVSKLWFDIEKDHFKSEA